MIEDSAEKQGSGCGRPLLIAGAVLIWVLLFFRKDAGILLGAIGSLLDSAREGSFNILFTYIENNLPALAFMMINLLGYAFIITLAIFILARVILPVRTLSETYQAMSWFFNYLSSVRLPVIFVKEGKLYKGGQPLEGPEALERIYRAVIIVDLNSAVVLEKQWNPLSPDVAGSGLARVGGPGLVFMGWGERLRGAISLRKQFRMVSQPIKAYTSDGIEVESRPFAIFTLGQPPTVLKVAYCGDIKADGLRVLKINDRTKKIEAVTDTLDPLEKEEIHLSAQQFLASKADNAPLEPAENYKEYPPHFLDDKRIKAAIYSRGRDVLDKKLEEWSDLPAQVVTGILRNMVSQVTYDSLFLPDDPNKFPLSQEFKPEMVTRVKFQGVLSYQFIFQHRGQPPEVGQVVDPKTFRIAPVQELKTSKILRDRGIKIIHAGFTPLKPLNQAVKAQRLESWRARWLSEADYVRADSELEVLHILSKARAQSQREMILKLSEILQKSSVSEEALALRVFNALEDIAADSSTQKILPRDTINMLRTLRLWLLPEETIVSGVVEDTMSSTE